MIVPAFVLSYKEQKHLIDKNILIKESKSNFTLEPVKYFFVDPRKEKEFYQEIQNLNEATTGVSRSFVVQSSTIIFTLLKKARTPTDLMVLTNCIISMYSIAPDYAQRFLTLIKSNMSDIQNQKTDSKSAKEKIDQILKKLI